MWGEGHPEFATSPLQMTSVQQRKWGRSRLYLPIPGWISFNEPWNETKNIILSNVEREIWHKFSRAKKIPLGVPLDTDTAPLHVPQRTQSWKTCWIPHLTQWTLSLPLLTAKKGHQEPGWVCEFLQQLPVCFCPTHNSHGRCPLLQQRPFPSRASTYRSSADASGMLTAASVTAIRTPVDRTADVAVALIVWEAATGDLRPNLCARGALTAASIVIPTLVNHCGKKGRSIKYCKGDVLCFL